MQWSHTNFIHTAKEFCLLSTRKLIGTSLPLSLLTYSGIKDGADWFMIAGLHLWVTAIAAKLRPHSVVEDSVTPGWRSVLFTMCVCVWGGRGEGGTTLVM